MISSITYKLSINELHISYPTSFRWIKINFQAWHLQMKIFFYLLFSSPNWLSMTNIVQLNEKLLLVLGICRTLKGNLSGGSSHFPARPSLLKNFLPFLKVLQFLRAPAWPNFPEGDKPIRKPATITSKFCHEFQILDKTFHMNFWCLVGFWKQISAIWCMFSSTEIDNFFYLEIGNFPRRFSANNLWAEFSLSLIKCSIFISYKSCKRR